MLIVNVKEGENIDKALKKLKKKAEKTKIMRNFRERQFYTKPSEERRQEVIKARYRKNMEEESQ